MKIEITKATESDIPLIQSLAKNSWESAYHGIISAEQIEYMLRTMYSQDELLSHFENKNYHYFLINFDGCAAGFLGYEQRFGPDTTKLHRIYLLPGAQGRGLGKMALAFLKNEVRHSGDHKIILNVNKNNSARKVYESQGFQVYDEVLIDIGGGFFMDDYLMCWSVSQEF